LNNKGMCQATYRVFRKKQPTVATEAYECLTPESAIPVGGTAMTCFLGPKVIATPVRARLSASWCPAVAPHLVVQPGRDLCVAQTPKILVPKGVRAPTCTTVSTTKGTDNNSTTETLTTCSGGVGLKTASLSGAVPAICPAVNLADLYYKANPLDYVVDGGGQRDACDGYVNQLGPGYYLPLPAPPAALKDNGMRLIGVKKATLKATPLAPVR
jgi:hypothetical protein